MQQEEEETSSQVTKYLRKPLLENGGLEITYLEVHGQALGGFLHCRFSRRHGPLGYRAPYCHEAISAAAPGRKFHRTRPQAESGYRGAAARPHHCGERSLGGPRKAYLAASSDHSLHGCEVAMHRRCCCCRHGCLTNKKTLLLLNSPTLHQIQFYRFSAEPPSKYYSVHSECGISKGQLRPSLGCEGGVAMAEGREERLQTRRSVGETQRERVREKRIRGDNERTDFVRP